MNNGYVPPQSGQRQRRSDRARQSAPAGQNQNYGYQPRQEAPSQPVRPQEPRRPVGDGGYTPQQNGRPGYTPQSNRPSSAPQRSMVSPMSSAHSITRAGASQFSLSFFILHHPSTFQTMTILS